MVTQPKTDSVVIGGGLVGGTLGVAFAQQGLSVTVVDRESQNNLLKPTLDGRTTFVSYGSRLIFDQLGIWEKVAPAAEPILTIRVFERGSPWAVYYDHQDVGDVPMGYIVENQVLRQGIFQRTQELNEHLNWIAPMDVAQTEYTPASAIVHLVNGDALKAPLVIGAEGRHSPTRDQAGLETVRWNYQQMALIAHVRHEKPHQGAAWEIFQPQGPFAILPLKACPTTGAFRSGIVWTGKPEDINHLLSLDDVAISKELQSLFPYFGDIHLSGQRWSYPLAAMVAKSVARPRLAIVGDAAHVIHPVAGQGVNLGWRDAQALAQAVGEAKRLGLDIGSENILRSYQRHRRLDAASILAMTDGMVRLFSNKSTILSFLRNAGLGAVNQTPPLKRRLMRRAMGL